MNKPFIFTITLHGLPALFIVLLLGISLSAAAENPDQIDPLTVSPDSFTLLLENEIVRVLEYRLQPGDRDNWHTHPAKVSYVLSGGRLRIHLENGESFEVDETVNAASWSGPLGRHYAENIGTTVVRILLVEPKEAINSGKP